MYLHNSGKKGVNVKRNNSNHEMESESEGRSVDKEITREQRDDSLNEVITEKGKVIKEKDEEIAKLRAENESLVEDYNKVKRIACKMDHEIKNLRSKLI